MRRFPPAFYRAGAIASFLTVASTLGLIFLPDLFATGEGLEVRMRRVTETPYVIRAWVYLLHPIAVFTAALAIALRLRRYAGLVLPGLIGFAVWAVTETGQQTMTLFMFDRWRRAWLAGDGAVRATMEVRAAVYDGLWDASYNLLLIGFLIGCAFYAAAMLRLPGLSRIVGLFYAAAALLTFSIMVVEVGGPSLPPLLDRWLYPATQPLARLLIGVWLWKHADEAMPIGSSSAARAQQ
jgi:hypothetical protein